MFNNQFNRKPGGPFSGIIVPILIYWGMSFLVDIVVLSAYVAGRARDLMAAYESESAFQSFMQETMTFLLSHSTEITTIAALFTLPFYLYMLRKDARYRAIAGGTTTPEKMPFWKYGYAALLGITAGIALNNILILSNLRSISISYQRTTEGLYATSVIVEVIGLGLIIPIVEECLYRGVIFRRLRDRTDAKRAILFSALIFAIVHGNLVQFLYAFVFGLILSYVYEVYESLKAPIVVHCAANLCSVILTEGEGYYWIFASPIRMGIITVGCAFAASVFFVFIRNIDYSKKMLQKY